MYTFNQQVFCLNTISNLSNGYNGTSEQIAAQASDAINKILSDTDVIALIGNWECVWGPQVVAAEGKALNTMYIAKNTDTNQYVVAIAGTDSRSLLDWFLEDFFVALKIDWAFGGANLNPKPMISRGTSIGLDSLRGMAVTVNGDHVHARDYLESVSATDVMVTGHSLGGALSPAYALYLKDTLDQWAPGGTANITCLPVAGATPGDQAFSDYYGQALGANTTRVWNSLDVVPHGFEKDMLNEIATIYDPQISTPFDVKAAVDLIKGITIGKGYTQLLPTVAGFASTIYSSAPTFGGQLVCQHICAYADYFGISDFQVRVQTLLNLPNPFFSEGCVQ